MFEDAEVAGLALLLTVASPNILRHQDFLLFGARSSPQLFTRCCWFVTRPGLHDRNRGFDRAHYTIPYLCMLMACLADLDRHSPGNVQHSCAGAGYLPVHAAGCWLVRFSTHLQAEGRRLLLRTPMQRIALSVCLPLCPDLTICSPDRLAWQRLGVERARYIDTACYGAVRGRNNITCRLLAASALTTLIGYVFCPKIRAMAGAIGISTLRGWRSPCLRQRPLHAQGQRMCGAIP